MKSIESKSSSRDTYFDVTHLRSDIKKRAIRGAGATVFSQSSIYGIQMIGTIVLARLLSPDDFGLIGMVTAFSLLLQNFGVNGFTEAVIQKEEIHHEQISTLFWINVALSSTLALLFMALAPLIVSFYKEPRLRSITIAIAFSIVFAGLSTHHEALLKRNMQFYRTSANEVVATFISLVLAISLAWRGWGYWALVTRRVALPLVTAVGAWILCRWRPGLPSRNTGVMPMLRFAINTYGNFTFTYFSRNLDKVLIGWRHGTQSLGHYGRAYYLFSMPADQLTNPVTSVAIATLSRVRDDPEKYRRSYLEAVSIIAFIGMVLSALLTLIGYDVILLLLGSQWKKAGQILSVFGPAVGIMLVYNTHGWLHLSLGRADRWFRWGIIAFIITGLFFLIGLPFGPVGVAVAYGASFYFLIVPGLWYAGKPINLKLSSIGLAIWRYCLAALGAGILCWFLLYSFDSTHNIFINLNIFVRILISLILCVSIYLGLIVALYQSIKPISQFFFLLHDMLPIKSSSKLRMFATLDSSSTKSD